MTRAVTAVAAALALPSFSAVAGEFGLRVFRDRDAWLAEAFGEVWAHHNGPETFDALTPQTLPDGASLSTTDGVRLTSHFGARITVQPGDASGTIDGTPFVDVTLSDPGPWITLGLRGYTFAWAAEFSGTSDHAGIGAQFGDALVGFNQFFQGEDGGFLGFVTSSLFEEVRLVARAGGEEFALDNVEWITIPCPSVAVIGVVGVASSRLRRRRCAVVSP